MDNRAFTGRVRDSGFESNVAVERSGAMGVGLSIHQVLLTSKSPRELLYLPRFPVVNLSPASEYFYSPLRCL